MIGKYIDILKVIEAQEADTTISQLRAMEARNLRAVLMGLIELLPDPKELKEMFNQCKERIHELIARPDYAGNHNHLNK